MIAYREDMDKQGCAFPGCMHDHSIIYLTGLCHPGSPHKVRYVKATGLLEMMCARCGELILSTPVASRTALSNVPYA
jgi:hypothetical protein